MRDLRVVYGSIASLALALANHAEAADPIPSQVLRDWKFYNDAGWRALSAHDYPRAEQRFRLAVETIQPYSANDQRLLARSYYDIATVFYYEQRYVDAIPLAKWALAVREKHPRVGAEARFQSLCLLAQLDNALRRYDEAEPLLRRALEVQEEALGANHPNEVMTLTDLAGVCRDEGKYPEAETLYKRALDIAEKSLPPTDPELANTVEGYAVLLRRMDRRSEAQILDSRSKTIRDAIAERQARIEAARFEAERNRAGFRGIH
jgi:tetratricopeptide (TPR) repeat protein